ncbi:MAG: hypothetical protein K1X88_09040 [Nannocystaceae bacterium]|nr:hypothetical protein [Nannocystaceae bacterium]
MSRSHGRARGPALSRAGLAFFVLSTAMLITPIYPWLGNHIEPRVLGLPWSLVYVLGMVAIDCLALAGLYVLRAVDHAELEDDPP